MSDFVAKTLHDGRYQILRVLGSGGMSIVFEALDTRLNVRRAVKVLHRRFSQDVQVRQRFETEAMAQASLRHPNILMVHDVIDDPDGVYLIMELADQGSLAQRIKAGGPMTASEVVRTAIDLAGALQVAHDAGMVHRDIKPENVLIDRHGVLKIADFGIARVVNRTMGLTRTGAILGTWSYMPPEQREGSASLDHRADIYALGVSMYYLLTMQQRSDLHNAEAYASAFEDWPEGLAGVVQKACRFNQEDRYDSCTDLAEALQGILDAVPDEPLVEVTEEELARQQGGGAATAVPSELTGFQSGNTTEPDIDVFEQRLAEYDAVESALTELAIPTGNTASHTIMAPLDEETERLEPEAHGSGVKLAMFASVLGGLLFVLLVGGIGLAVFGPELLAERGEGPTGEADGVGGDDGLALAGNGDGGEDRHVLEGTTDDLHAVTAGTEGEEGDEGSAEAGDPEGGSADAGGEGEGSENTTGDGEISSSGTGSSAGTGSAQESSGGSASGGSGSSSGSSTGGPRVITIKSTGSNTEDTLEDDTTSSLPAAATGYVRVRTVPSGATVSSGGKALAKAGGSYTLPVGSHLLELRSSEGETTRIPVQVRRDATVDICYSFDTNSACGS